MSSSDANVTLDSHAHMLVSVSPRRILPIEIATCALCGLIAVLVRAFFGKRFRAGCYSDSLVPLLVGFLIGAALQLYERRVTRTGLFEGVWFENAVGAFAALSGLKWCFHTDELHISIGSNWCSFAKLTAGVVLSNTTFWFTLVATSWIVYWVASVDGTFTDFAIDGLCIIGLSALPDTHFVSFHLAGMWASIVHCLYAITVLISAANVTLLCFFLRLHYYVFEISYLYRFIIPLVVSSVFTWIIVAHASAQQGKEELIVVMVLSFCILIYVCVYSVALPLLMTMPFFAEFGLAFVWFASRSRQQRELIHIIQNALDSITFITETTVLTIAGIHFGRTFTAIETVTLAVSAAALTLRVIFSVVLLYLSSKPRLEDAHLQLSTLCSLPFANVLAFAYAIDHSLLAPSSAVHVAVLSAFSAGAVSVISEVVRHYKRIFIGLFYQNRCYVDLNWLIVDGNLIIDSLQRVLARDPFLIQASWNQIGESRLTNPLHRLVDQLIVTTREDQVTEPEDGTTRRSVTCILPEMADLVHSQSAPVTTHVQIGVCRQEDEVEIGIEDRSLFVQSAAAVKPPVGRIVDRSSDDFQGHGHGQSMPRKKRSLEASLLNVYMPGLRIEEHWSHRPVLTPFTNIESEENTAEKLRGQYLNEMRNTFAQHKLDGAVNGYNYSILLREFEHIRDKVGRFISPLVFERCRSWILFLVYSRLERLARMVQAKLRADDRVYIASLGSFRWILQTVTELEGYALYLLVVLGLDFAVLALDVRFIDRESTWRYYHVYVISPTVHHTVCLSVYWVHRVFVLFAGTMRRRSATACACCLLRQALFFLPDLMISAELLLIIGSPWYLSHIVHITVYRAISRFLKIFEISYLLLRSTAVANFCQRQVNSNALEVFTILRSFADAERSALELCSSIDAELAGVEWFPASSRKARKPSCSVNRQAQTRMDYATALSDKVLQNNYGVCSAARLRESVTKILRVKNVEVQRYQEQGWIEDEQAGSMLAEVNAASRRVVALPVALISPEFYVRVAHSPDAKLAVPFAEVWKKYERSGRVVRIERIANSGSKLQITSQYAVLVVRGKLKVSVLNGSDSIILHRGSVCGLDRMLLDFRSDSVNQVAEEWTTEEAKTVLAYLHWSDVSYLMSHCNAEDIVWNHLGCNSLIVLPKLARHCDLRSSSSRGSATSSEQDGEDTFSEQDFSSQKVRNFLMRKGTTIQSTIFQSADATYVRASRREVLLTVLLAGRGIYSTASRCGCRLNAICVLPSDDQVLSSAVFKFDCPFSGHRVIMVVAEHTEANFDLLTIAEVDDDPEQTLTSIIAKSTTLKYMAPVLRTDQHLSSVSTSAPPNIRNRNIRRVVITRGLCQPEENNFLGVLTNCI